MASRTVIPPGAVVSPGVTFVPGEATAGIMVFGVQPRTKSQPPGRPVPSTIGWSIYRPAHCGRRTANSSIVVFLHDITLMGVDADLRALLSGLQRERSASSARVILDFLPATVST